MDARAHKRAVCAELATYAHAQAHAIEHGGGTGRGDERRRRRDGWVEVAEEFERRGQVVGTRSPEPTEDTPALPYPDQIERVEQASAENG